MKKNKEIIKFELKGDFIQLIQLLKACSLVENGGMAQMVVTEGMVKRNGEVETRKRAKIVRGEKIEFENFVIEIE